MDIKNNEELIELYKSDIVEYRNEMRRHQIEIEKCVQGIENRNRWIKELGEDLVWR